MAEYDTYECKSCGELNRVPRVRIVVAQRYGKAYTAKVLAAIEQLQRAKAAGDVIIEGEEKVGCLYDCSPPCGCRG
jgi:hypothetical protein